MKEAIVKITFFFVLLITTASVATPTHWQAIEPDIDYTKISFLSGFHTGYVHAFRISLKDYQLKLAIAEDERNKIASVQDLTVANKGLIGINGGFFSQELKPLGLRIANRVERSPLKSTPWWNVFYIMSGRPYIVSQKQFKGSKNVELALQSGPRLVKSGHVLKTLKPGVDSRTAIGITKDNQVVLVVTENLSLTTTQLAQIMAASQIEGGLGCIDALNLDGGSSSQLYAKTTGLTLSIMGYSAVTDALLVLPKNK